MGVMRAQDRRTTLPPPPSLPPSPLDTCKREALNGSGRGILVDGRARGGGVLSGRGAKQVSQSMRLQRGSEATQKSLADRHQAREGGKESTTPPHPHWGLSKRMTRLFFCRLHDHVVLQFLHLNFELVVPHERCGAGQPPLHLLSCAKGDRFLRQKEIQDTTKQVSCFFQIQARGGEGDAFKMTVSVYTEK